MDARPVTAAEASKLLDPLGRYPHLALAVSGGADSLALLHLMARAGAPRRGSRPDLTVLTVDHGLRAAIARRSRDGDAHGGETRPAACDSHLDAGREARAGGLQERARAARYDLMAAYCHAHDIPALVTAHHLDDQAETFLMRLKRGSGLDGLAAIPEESVWSGIAVLAASARHAEGAACRDARRGRSWLGGGSEQSRRALRARAGAREPRRAGEARAHAGGARPLGAAAHGARARRSTMPRDEFLADAWRHERSRLLRDRSRRAHRRAGGDRASRAGARAVQCRQRQGGTASACEARIAARSAEAKIRRPRIRSAAAASSRIGGRLGVFRETRGTGLPSLQLAPGERALWDNRFAVELRK